MEDKKRNMITLLIRSVMAIFALIVMIYLGYLVGGILGYAEVSGSETHGLSSLGAVLSNPFGNYYNSLTPITVTLAIVVGEFIVFLVMMKSRKKALKEDVEEEQVDEALAEEPEQVTVDNIIESADIFNNFLSFEEDVDLNNTVEPENPDSEPQIFIPDEEPDAVMEEMVVKVADDTHKSNSEGSKANTGKVSPQNFVLLELSDIYSQEQLEAITKLLEYAPDLDAAQVKKMIQPEMDADEIRDYISILYE